jgi:hypothetical protein
MFIYKNIGNKTGNNEYPTGQQRSVCLVVHEKRENKEECAGKRQKYAQIFQKEFHCQYELKMQIYIIIHSIAQNNHYLCAYFIGL